MCVIASGTGAARAGEGWQGAGQTGGLGAYDWAMIARTFTASSSGSGGPRLSAVPLTGARRAPAAGADPNRTGADRSRAGAGD